MKKVVMPAFIAAIMLVFSLAGCSGTQNMTEDTLKGVWSLDSGSELGFDAYVNFGDDSALEMLIADSWLTGTWSVSGSEATLTIDEGLVLTDEGELTEGDSSTRTAKLTYSNNKLTLGSSNGSKLVFAKDDSEDAKSMFNVDDEGVDGGNNQELEYVEEVIDPISPAVSIADDDKFTIQVTGKGTDYTGDPCYVLSITNKTDKSVYIVPKEEFTVGGKSIEAGIGDEIEAGATIETEMYFSKSELGGAAEALTTTDGVLEIYDDDNDDEVFASYTFHME